MTFTFYLGTPGQQLQAHLAKGQPVLVSYTASSPWLERGAWMLSYSSLLLDSGAYSVMASEGAVSVDPLEYRDWADRFPWAVARAGLDDINGDWKASLRNYSVDPIAFPTFHNSDPDELLESELIPMARERGRWIGLGLTLPRQRKEHFLRSALERIPDDLHVHGWACGSYSYLNFDSVDSTNWFMDVKYILDGAHTKHLTVGEALEIIVKRYQRAGRKGDTDQSLPLFSDEGGLLT